MDATYFYLDKNGTIHNERISLCVKMLSVIRVRDKNTGREGLSLELFNSHEDPAPYAITSCGLLDLHSDLIRLREFGFLATRKEIMKMVKIIEDKYYELECIVRMDAKTLEADLQNIVRYTCGFIFQQGIKAVTVGSNELYNIPVGDFSNLLKSSPFSHHPQKDIKQMLCDMGYTVCSNGRADNTIKVNKKAVKVISFYADELFDFVQDNEYEGE